MSLQGVLRINLFLFNCEAVVAFGMEGGVKSGIVMQKVGQGNFGQEGS